MNMNSSHVIRRGACHGFYLATETRCKSLPARFCGYVKYSSKTDCSIQSVCGKLHQMNLRRIAEKKEKGVSALFLKIGLFQERKIRLFFAVLFAVDGQFCKSAHKIQAHDIVNFLWLLAQSVKYRLISV